MKLTLSADIMYEIKEILDDKIAQDETMTIEIDEQQGNKYISIYRIQKSLWVRTQYKW